MFTGLISSLACVQSINFMKGTAKLELSDCGFVPILGESISINGVCLTVTRDKVLEFEISKETLNVTTLKYLNVGSKVNIERAMCATDRFGGHIVSGHIDTTAEVKKCKNLPGGYTEIQCVLTSCKDGLIISKGSIAINGVSLTVNRVDNNNFSVMLIPATLDKTNLSDLVKGDHANIEFDHLGKYIIAYMKTFNPKVVE